MLKEGDIMSLFNSNKQNQHLTPAQTLENQYKSGVSNLLLVVAFTVVNLVLLISNSNRYFLFSAYLPYFIADMGMYLCGRYPAEYYYGDEIFYDNSYFIIMLAVAACILLVYVLCWFMAKKKKVGWLIFGLVFFCLDTVAFIVLNGLSSDGIGDIVFHVWVIVYLINGIRNFYKLKRLPAEMPVPDYNGSADEAQQGFYSPEAGGAEGEAYPVQQAHPGSAILRMADPDVKSRILLEAQAAGHTIVYRRVKRVNELIVDGRVYDEYEALMEMPHTLVAVIDADRIEVVYEASGMIKINVNGETVAKKLRLI